MDVLLPEYKNLLLLLIKHEVQFMLIGGYAVIYYGYERTTSDMDIWLSPENKNRDKVMMALAEYGIEQEDLEQLKSKDFTKINFFYIGDRPSRIDFLNKVKGVEFEEAIKQANHFPLKDQSIPIIQYHHLILTKIMNSRPKDKADVEELQRINALRKKKFED